MSPLLVLLVGMAAVIGAILVLRLHAFLALVGAAILVSLLAPGEAATKVARVAEGFGRTAGSIGIAIALAAIIGRAMVTSGAADRIVQGFLSLLGERRGAAALGATGFVLSVPVFFDTVFYLLVPLARSMTRRVGRHYLRYLLAIAAGAAATHTLVPPTPGPLAVAGALGVDVGTMLLAGLVVALPGAVAGLAFAAWADRRMPVPLRPTAGDPDPAAEPDPARLTGLVPAVLPIVVPVLLIALNTTAGSLAAGAPTSAWGAAVPTLAVIGNANLALLLSAVLALVLHARGPGAGREPIAELVETALAGAGTIILVTAAGGAFGAALQAARIGPAVQALVLGRETGAGLALLFLAFTVSAVLKIAQGSSTVAMITTAGMLAAMVGDAGALPFHAVYLATATGAGSLVGTWMNDSGFWVISRMGGLTERETLRTWTPLSAIVGATAMLTTIALALFVPLR